MSEYLILFRIAASHEYFGSGRMDARFEPFSHCRTFMANAGLTLKNGGHEAAVYYDVSDTERLKTCLMDRDSPMDFHFYVQTGYEHFRNFTLMPKNELLLHYGNSGVEQNQEPLVLVEEDAEAPRVKVSPSQSFVATARIGSWGSSGLISDKGVITPRTFVMAFKSRKTHWVYHVKKKREENRDMVIEDYHREVGFTLVGESLFSTSNAYLTFLSDKAIPFLNRSKRIFQLKEKNGDTHRMIMDRLPAASPKVIHKLVKGASEIQVSEIFINH